MSDKEWREASDLRSRTLLMVTVLAVAATLRFWALGHGIPFAVGIDEPEIATRVVRMMKTGDFNPHFFDYGGALIYLHLVVACVRFLVGAVQGAWTSLDQVGAGDFYLWGRAVTAGLGVATVWIVWAVGTRWGARHALLAAGLMAVMPNHVRESHYMLADVPVTFFTALTFLLALRASESGRLGAYAWAGAAAGLAAATKYNGALAVLLPLVAAASHQGPRRDRLARTLVAVGAPLGAFLVVSPYAILALPEFLNGFARLVGEHGPGRPPAEAAWVTYFKHLRLGLGWPALGLACSGLALATVRTMTGPGHVRWFMLAAFPAIYFAIVSGQKLVWARYLLPILPFIALLVATAVVSGVSLLRRFDIPRAPRTTLIAILTVAAIVPPAVTAIGFCRDVGRTSTHALAFEWIRSHIPAGSRIAIETHFLQLPDDRYRVEYFPRLITHDYPYFAARFDYLVASSHAYGAAFESPEQRPEEYAAYRRLFDQSALLATIDQSPDHPGPSYRVFRLRP